MRSPGRKRAPRPPLACERLEARTLLAGHTLATATVLPFLATQTAAVAGFLATDSEVDVYAVNLQGGDTVRAAVGAQQAGSPLDAALRIFDNTGRPIASNDNFTGRDPALTFQAPSAGTYYVGVSSAGNTQYNPATGSGSPGTTTGLYALQLARANVPLAADPEGAAFQVGGAPAVWGDTVTVRFTVENRGGAAVPAPFPVQLLLSTNHRFDGTGSDLAVGTPVTVPALPAGAAFTTNPFSVQLPATPPPGFPTSGTVFLGFRTGKAFASPEQGNDWAAVLVLVAQAASGANHSLATADPLALNARVSDTLSPGGADFYRLSVPQDGRLVAQLKSFGRPARLSLLDSNGQVLVQTDGLPDPLLDRHLSAAGAGGTYYLDVQALGGGPTTLTAQFQPANAPGTFVQEGGQPPEFPVTADFNGDGIPDLANVNVSTGTVSVLMGRGDGTFAPPLVFAVGGTPAGLVVGDFNGDGIPDLAVPDGASGTVSVLLGNGDGTFQTPQTFATGGTSLVALTAADFTGDGRLDLAAADGSSDTVSVLLGNGDGTFQAPQSFAVPVGAARGAHVTALAAGDFNGDGMPDLAAAVSGAPGTVAVFLGRGNGTFGSAATVTVGTDPVALVAGDFNGDGRLDLATADPGSSTVSVLLGHGDGTFAAAVPFAVGSGPAGLVAADFNNDGKLDLATPDLTGGDVTILAGRGDGTFQAQPRLPLPDGPSPTGAVAADFNGDGRLDLAVTSANPDARVLILLDPGQPLTQGTAARPGGAVPGAAPSPRDVTAQVRLRRVYLSRIFGRLFVERIALTNLGPTTLGRPLWLVLDDLSRGVRLVSRTGRTRWDAPVGSPYQWVPVHRLRPGQTCTMVLLFVIPPRKRLFDDAQLLEGPGPL